jgi:hypothetical protein
MAQREADPFGAFISFGQSLALDPLQDDLAALLGERTGGKPRDPDSFGFPGTVRRTGSPDVSSGIPRPQPPDPTRAFPQPPWRSR